MVFFRSAPWSEPSLPEIAGDGIVLRTPQMADYPAWARLRAESRAFLVPWEPAWPSDELSRGSFRRRLRRYARDLREDTAYAFFVFEPAAETLLGGIALSNVRRGVAQAASLGYWMGKPHAGKGHMTAAVRALVPFAFATLRLHRIDAACVPGNSASLRLLEKCGFRREGYARAYLCINNKWEDHVLFARLADDPPA